MLWTILIVLLVLWLIGFLGGFAGNLIHLVLVAALAILLINVFPLLRKQKGFHAWQASLLPGHTGQHSAREF